MMRTFYCTFPWWMKWRKSERASERMHYWRIIRFCSERVVNNWQFTQALTARMREFCLYFSLHLNTSSHCQSIVQTHRCSWFHRKIKRFDNSMFLLNFHPYIRTFQHQAPLHARTHTRTLFCDTEMLNIRRCLFILTAIQQFRIQ